MTVTARCPECQGTFHLHPSMAGRQIRCPDCDTVFRVEPDPPPVAVGEFRPAPTQRSSFLASGPEVVAWDAGMVPPGDPNPEPGPIGVPRPGPSAVDERLRVLAQKRRRGRRRVILAGLVLFAAAGTVAGGAAFLRYRAAAPDRLHAQMESANKDGRYEAARKLAEALAREHPESPHAPQARFFAGLNAWRSQVFSAVNRANPTPAVEGWKRWEASLAADGLQEYASRGRFGVDVWGTLVKLHEDVVAHAGDLLTDDATLKTEEWLDVAQGLRSDLGRYRPEGGPADDGANELADLEARVRAKKARLGALEVARKTLGGGTFDSFEQAKRYLASVKLDRDPVALSMLAAAEGALSERVRFIPQEPPLPSRREEPAPPIAVVRVLKIDGDDKLRPDGRPLLLSAGGLIYALDEGDGSFLWADSTGPGGSAAPLVIRGAAGAAELVVYQVPSGAGVALRARDPNRGAFLWEADLPGLPVGSPLVIGPSVWVAVELATPAGLPSRQVLLEYATGDGSLLGRIEPGRPLAGAGSHRAGSHRWVVPAEAGVVLVFEVGRAGDDGRPAPAALVATLASGHAEGTLSGDPLLGGQEGEEPAWVTLLTRDGTRGGRCTRYPLLAGGAAKDLAFEGWASLPIPGDGETVALLTDLGEVTFLNDVPPSGRDEGVYRMIPPIRLSAAGSAPRAARWVWYREQQAGVVFGDRLYRLRRGITREGGPVTRPDIRPVEVGEPTGWADGSGGAAAVVARDGRRGATVASCFDPETGQLRWSRQLASQPLRLVAGPGGEVLSVDRAGAALSLDPTRGRKLTFGWQQPAAASGSLGPAGRAASDALVLSGDPAFLVTLGADAKLVWRALSPQAKGPVPPATALPAEARSGLARVGDKLLVAAADGLIYRCDARRPGSAAVAGPPWGNRIGAYDRAEIVATGAETFVVLSGTRITSWEWPAAEAETPKRLRELDLPQAVEHLEAARDTKGIVLSMADPQGQIVFWTSDRPGKVGPRWVPPDPTPARRLLAGREEDGTPRLFVERVEGVYVIDFASGKQVGEPRGGSGARLTGTMAEPLVVRREGSVERWKGSEFVAVPIRLEKEDVLRLESLRALDAGVWLAALRDGSWRVVREEPQE